MSNDSNRGGGSDLDIFEGLGKKSEKTPAAAPPPPPGSSSHVVGATSKPVMPVDAKKTLLGIAGPASSERVPSQPPPLPPHVAAQAQGRGSQTNLHAAPQTLVQGGPQSRPVPPQSEPPSGNRNPPPPPGRGALPNLKSNPPSQSAGPHTMPMNQQQAPHTMPMQARTSSSTTTVAQAAPGIAKTKNGKLDMDWDDDQEATHVYDKDKEGSKPNSLPPALVVSGDADQSSEVLRGPESKEPERASMDAIMSTPPRTSSSMPAAAPISNAPPVAPAAGTPPPPPSANSASLSGAFGALGQPREKTNGAPSGPPSAGFRSGAPTSTSMRSAPPPPPTSQKNPSLSTAPVPPPPPGQVTTAPMHMPPQPPGMQRPASIPPAPPGHSTLQSAQAPMPIPPSPSGPPQYASGHHHAAAASVPAMPIPSAPPAPYVAPSAPPVNRAMEQTMMTRPSSSKTPLIVALLVMVMGIAGAAVFFMMPRSGTLVVNVSDSKGGAVQNLEVLVDGTKRCDSAPCIVRDVAAGVHEVKVSAKGYEVAAPKAVTIDGRTQSTNDFTLVPVKASAGTGFKVSSAHNGVKLTVDGKDIGPLPQELRDLEPGEHKLRFAGDRYAPLEKTVSVAKDEIVDLGTINLKVLKGKATINLGTPGAKVYLVNGSNRKEVPQFPMAIEFDPNEKWELQATKDGFDEYKEKISFDDGQAEKTFTVTLSPKSSSPVAVNTPHAVPQAAPAPVAHNTPAAKTEPNSAAEPKESGKKEPAAAGGAETVLKINSLPASSIVLDGKPIGVTPQLHVVVSPGTHTVMFVNSEQSLKKTISVDVKAGETKAAFAKLRD